MRVKFRKLFLIEVKRRIKPLMRSICLESFEYFEPPWAEAVCDFSSPSRRLRVALGNGHLMTVNATLAKPGKKRWFRRSKMREFGCGFLAEAMGFEDICSFPVRKPEDLEREVERLAEWLRAHGEKLVSATDADWDRASEIANEKFKRKEQVRRNSEAYAKIDQTRQKAEAAHLAANLQGVIDAYEEIEDWLVPSEMEMLEKARRALAQKSGRS